MSLKEHREQIATEEIQRTLANIGVVGAHIVMVGSAYIADCVTSDVDMLVYHKSISSHEMGDIDGWKYGGSDKGGDGWASFTQVVQGININMIIVDELKYLHDWVQSAEVCRLLHLTGVSLPRELVHAVHSIVMDDGCALMEIQRRNIPCSTE